MLPTDPKARKDLPMARGVLDYFPRAFAALAGVSLKGNQQHNPGQPMHWAKEKSTDHADCIMRHLSERGTIDTDGERHSAKVLWRAAANLEIELLAEEGDPEAVKQVRALGTVAQNARLDRVLAEREKTEAMVAQAAAGPSLEARAAVARLADVEAEGYAPRGDYASESPNTGRT